MRSTARLLSVALRSVLLVAPVSVPAASAQVGAPGGNISVFADPFGSTCFLMDDAPRAFSVYVVHTNVDNSNGITATEFAFVTSEGFTATYLSETIHYPTYYGTLAGGISIGFGICALEPGLLATVNYVGHGTSEACSFLDTGPNLTLPYVLTEPLAIDCIFNDYPAPSVGRLLVNPAPGQCSPWCVVATQQTTWGRLKALYR
jgi:hypothetical protein